MIAIVFWSVRDILPPLPALPSFGSSPAPRVPARATPDLSLTQHQRADKLIKLQLSPALVATSQAEQTMSIDCSSGHQLDPACRADMADVYHRLTAIVDQIDRADVPPCIQVQLQDYRNHLNLGAQLLAQGVSAFDRHDGDSVTASLQDFTRNLQASVASGQAVQAADNACVGGD